MIRIIYGHGDKFLVNDTETELPAFLRNKEHWCCPLRHGWFNNCSLQQFTDLYLLQFSIFRVVLKQRGVEQFCVWDKVDPNFRLHLMTEQTKFAHDSGACCGFSLLSCAVHRSECLRLWEGFHLLPYAVLVGKLSVCWSLRYCWRWGATCEIWCQLRWGWDPTSRHAWYQIQRLSPGVVTRMIPIDVVVNRLLVSQIWRLRCGMVDLVSNPPSPFRQDIRGSYRWGDNSSLFFTCILQRTSVLWLPRYTSHHLEIWRYKILLFVELLLFWARNFGPF